MGLFFLLLPGTFLGVWNLIAISEGHSATEVSAAWLQAHGHAQIFGWIGSFIIGVGFYSLSKMGNVQPFAVTRGWICWILWSGGVLLRWTTNLYGWEWRGMLPVSALMEFCAFLLFFQSVSRQKRKHLQAAKQNGERKKEIWMKLVSSSTIGFLLTLLANFGSALYVALTGDTPALPHAVDQRFLILALWGFVALSIWGFSARWLPVFLGLRKPDDRLLLLALACVSTGVITTGATRRPGGRRVAPDRFGQRSLRAAYFCAFRTAAEDAGNSWQFPCLCAHCIRMDVDCSGYFHLGPRFGPGGWNLGGFAPRLDRRIYFDNGVLYWPAGASRFLRHAHTIFAKPDVRFLADVEYRLRHPRWKRDCRVRKQSSGRMESLASIGDFGNGCRDSIRAKPDFDSSVATCS